MSYYDDPENIQQYIDMAAGYDGRELVAALSRHLPPGADLLELGMGPEVDLDLLSRHYRVTSSDTSQVFLDRCREMRLSAYLLLLETETTHTSRKFNAIYSNKVLHHLSPKQLEASIHHQYAVLQPPGIALHSLWLEDHEEFMQGHSFRYFPEDFLLALVEPNFTVLESRCYTEFESDDSLYLFLKRI